MLYLQWKLERMTCKCPSEGNQLLFLAVERGTYSIEQSSQTHSQESR